MAEIKGWQIVKESIVLVVLLLLSAYTVYFSSAQITRLFFLLLLCLFLVSRRDYFWFAYFFILSQGPGFFFADYSGASLYRLPLYNVLPNYSFGAIDFFVILAFCKAITHGRKVRLNLEKPLAAFLMYIIFTVVVSSFIFGGSIQTLAWNGRWVFYYSIIISFLYLVNKKKDMYHFVLLVFPIVFFVLFTQIYYVATGMEFINVVNPGYRGVVLNTVTGELRPGAAGILAIFFSFVFSFFLLVNGDFKFPKIYLYFIVVLAFLSVFLSATRIWFVLFSLIFAGYVLISKNKIVSTVGFVSISLLIVSILIYMGLIPSDLLFKSSWVRLQQVFYVVEGNIYSIDTARNRLVKSVPVLMNLIKQNPFLGYGFSNITMSYYDNDLGFMNTILMFGLIGFSLLIFFFIRMFTLLVSFMNKISIRNPFKNSLKIMTLAWVGILIGYSLTWDFFAMDFYKIFFVSLLIALTELSIKQANEVELSIQRKIYQMKKIYLEEE